VEISPELGSATRENRSFTARAVDWAARQGIRQFADLGAGLPAHPSPRPPPAQSSHQCGSSTSTTIRSSPHVRALLVTGDGANHSCAAGGFPQDGRRALPQKTPRLLW
jgi:hypothetical protein